MKISEHFDIRELVAPEWWIRYGENCKNFIHPNVKYTLEDLREVCGKIKINDWHQGGLYKESGLRSPGWGDGKLTVHKTGCAFDIKPELLTCEELYYHIMSNQNRYPFIFRMENVEHTKTWVHVEIGCRRKKLDIVIFNP